MHVPGSEHLPQRDSCCSDEGSFSKDGTEARQAICSHAEIDDSGRVVFDNAVSMGYGFKPGAPLLIEQRPEGLLLRRPVTHLSRIYLEPTGHCNLTCRTCQRDTWDESPGQMSSSVFQRVLDGIRAASPPPAVVFGGFGEPLLHPDLTDWVASVKRLKARVELITNATLLVEDVARKLIDGRLDMLWVSLDGATPDGYARVRTGVELSRVLEHVKKFRELAAAVTGSPPSLGIVFVATRSNVGELPELLRLADRLRVRRVLVSNVVAYSPGLKDDSLFDQSLPVDPHPADRRCRKLTLPRFDPGALSAEILGGIHHSGWVVESAGGSAATVRNRCPFVDAGAMAVRHDGRVSPCLPLMHNHSTHLLAARSDWRAYTVGNLEETPLEEIWSSPAYLSFRQRVQAFDFAPCTACAGCAFSADNLDDCFGSGFPSCGACPWAQGFVLCP